MKTGKKKPFPESILNKLNFLKNGFHYRRFPANVLKLLRKLRTTTSQQTFVLVKTYWRRLEDVFSVIFFCLPRRIEDVLKTSCMIRVEFRTSKIEYKMDLFAKIVKGCSPSTIFVKKSISDAALSLKTILLKVIINFLKSQTADLFAN